MTTPISTAQPINYRFMTTPISTAQPINYKESIPKESDAKVKSSFDIKKMLVLNPVVREKILQNVSKEDLSSFNTALKDCHLPKIYKKGLERFKTQVQTQSPTKSLNPNTSFYKLLHLPLEVQELILNGVTFHDSLIHLYDAIGKGRNLEGNDKTAFEAFQAALYQERVNRKIIHCVTLPYPEWETKAIKYWPVSTKERAWLLQVHQLYLYGFEIPHMKSLYPNKDATPKDRMGLMVPVVNFNLGAGANAALNDALNAEVNEMPVQNPANPAALADDFVVPEEGLPVVEVPVQRVIEEEYPSRKALELLQHVDEINRYLCTITHLDLSNKNVSIPWGIFHLLPNLNVLILNKLDLKDDDLNDDNLKQFLALKNLRVLSLAENKLTQFPDISGCPKLEKLILTDNPLCKLPGDEREAFSFKRLNQAEIVKLANFKSNRRLKKLDLAGTPLAHLINPALCHDESVMKALMAVRKLERDLPRLDINILDEDRFNLLDKEDNLSLEKMKDWL